MNIWLGLLSHESPTGALQNIHFPLSIGLIAEYIRAKAGIQLNIKLFKRPSLLIKALSTEIPDIVMFGNYMWNEKLNLFFAKRIKEMNPETLVVFGGPNLSLVKEERERFVRENASVDMVIDGDAELSATQIVRAFSETGRNIESLKRRALPNTLSCLHHESQHVVTGITEENRLGVGETSLDEIPSPYLSGAMDIFFEEGAVPLVESNRGCPYSCSYCQQAATYFSNIRFYSPERIGKELEYIAKRVSMLKLNIQIIEFADPNFGMYKNDFEVFKEIKRIQDEWSFPEQIWCSTGKAQAQRILDHVKLVKPGSIMIRAAVQSMNEITLKNVHRKNLPISVITGQSTSEVEVYSDVMLGLPSETLDSYIDGFYKLIDEKVDEFSMPTTLLLKGTPMETKEYREEYGLKGRYRVIPECSNVYKLGSEKRISETELVVCQTSQMNPSDYFEARKFNLVIMIYHNTRLLRPIYRYFDGRNIRRSKALRAIWNAVSELKILEGLFSSYEKALRDELFDLDLEFDVSDSVSELTSNKVFRFTSLALMTRHDEIIELAKFAMSKLGGLLPQEDAKFLLDMISESLLKKIEVSEELRIMNLPENLKNIMGARTVEIGQSEFQNRRMEALLSRYHSEQDILNNLGYHLRALNMVKTIRFS